MLNALNEVLRDDYIKDSNAGVERWNKVIEKAGIPFRLTVPHKAFNRRSARWPACGVARRPVISEPNGTPRSTTGCPATTTAPSWPA
jgi:hypothetical protein